MEEMSVQSQFNVTPRKLIFLAWVPLLIAALFLFTRFDGALAQAAPTGPQAIQGGGCQPWTLIGAVPNPRTHHYLNDVDALAPDDMWAVGEYYDESNYTPDTALAMHWDGVQWTIFPTPPTGQRGELRGVTMIAPDNVWAVGLKYSGGPYVPLILHWDGTQWSEVPSPTEAGGLLLNDVVALAPNDVWAVGANDGFHATRAMHWDGAAWTIVPTPNGGGFSDDNVLEAVSAVSPTDIWAVGYIYPKGGTPRTLTLHWNGTQWTLVTSPNPGNYFRALYGVTAIAANDVWAVGSYSYNSGETYLPLFLRWNGAQWQHIPGPDFPDYSVLRDVHAITPDSVWAVGTNATCNFCDFETLTMHWDGSTWTRVFSPNGSRDFSRLYGVTATSVNDIWAVGFTDNYGFPYTSDPLIMRRVCTGGGSPTPTRTPAPPTATAPSATPSITSTPTSPATTATVTPTQPASTPTVVVPTATAHIATGTPSQSTFTPQASTTSQATPPYTATPTSTSISPATSTPTVCTLTFTDVPQNHTFYSEIRCLACRGVIGGYGDGSFKPGNDITRGQIAKMVSNAGGFQEPVGGQTYQDVPPTQTFWVWIERLSQRGYMGGYPCGQRTTEPCLAGNRPYFRLSELATRGQLSKIVSNASLNNDPVSGQYYTDVPPTNPFYTEIMRLTNDGVMSGYPCGGAGEPCDGQNRPYFRWGANVTRGQASKIVANTFFPGCNTAR